MITIRTTPLVLMSALFVVTCAFLFVADVHSTVEKAAFIWSTSTIMGFLGFSGTLASIGKLKINTDSGGWTQFNWNVAIPFLYALAIPVVIIWQMSGVFQLTDDTAIIGAVSGINGAALGVIGAMVEPD